MEGLGLASRPIVYVRMKAMGVYKGAGYYCIVVYNILQCTILLHKQVNSHYRSGSTPS